MAGVDWEKGLPPDVLGLVAKAGGLKEMMGMRGACKTWQQGYELGVTAITIHFEDPVLPLGAEAAQRFPGLKVLSIGDSRTEVGDLQGLRALPNLDTLILGKMRISEVVFGGLAERMNNGGMMRLHGLPLTHLGLHGCRNVMDWGMGWLRGMPLRLLDLQSCPGVRDEGLNVLKGMQLEGLTLTSCQNLSHVALDCLRGAPLAKLNLWGCSGILRDEGLERLRGFPLTSLGLSCPDSDYLTESSLEPLTGMPLKTLSLFYWNKLTDVSLGNLSCMPLSSLSLSQCWQLTDAGIALLRGFSLTCLDLSGCSKITDMGLCHLQGLQLTSLGLGCCNKITPAGLDVLLGMSLTNLSLKGWRSFDAVFAADVAKRLFLLPLSSLDLTDWYTVKDATILCLLEALPLLHINVCGCQQLSRDIVDTYPTSIVKTECGWSASFAMSFLSL